jgi:hypothetical protein
MNKDYKKLYEKWKVIGTVLIIFTCIMLIFSVVVDIREKIEDNKTKVCFYEICADLPDAEYYDDVCSCYDYDTLGRLTLVKEVYLK